MQDDDNALLQQALAMSMDDATPAHGLEDTDMSDAASVDPDLKLGNISLFSVLHICPQR